MKIKPAKIEVYKEGSRWFADIVWNDGKVWRRWCNKMPSKKSVLAHIEAVSEKLYPNTPVERVWKEAA